MTTRFTQRRAAAVAVGVVITLGVGVTACAAPMPAPTTSTTTTTVAPTTTTTEAPTTTTTVAPTTTTTTTTTIPTGPVTLVPNPIAVATLGGTANGTVYWNGQPANKLIFIDICRKSIEDASFDNALDCAPLSQLVRNGTSNGNGSATLKVFRGEEASGDLGWGCFKSTDTAPNGVTKYTTCYVRVANDNSSNFTGDVEQAFTIS